MPLRDGYSTAIRLLQDSTTVISLNKVSISELLNHFEQGVNKSCPFFFPGEEHTQCNLPDFR